jgi:hypothetical protein
MEKLSAFLGVNSMSDAAIAHGLIRAAASHSWDGKADMIDRLHTRLARRFPASHWTRRRVRSLWHKEAARIEFREVAELATIAAEAETIKTARSAHADYVAETMRLAARFAAVDPDFHGPEIERLGRALGGMDRAGTQGSLK